MDILLIDDETGERREMSIPSEWSEVRLPVRQPMTAKWTPDPIIGTLPLQHRVYRRSSPHDRIGLRQAYRTHPLAAFWVRVFVTCTQLRYDMRDTIQGLIDLASKEAYAAGMASDGRERLASLRVDVRACDRGEVEPFVLPLIFFFVGRRS